MRSYEHMRSYEVKTRVDPTITIDHLVIISSRKRERERERERRVSSSCLSHPSQTDEFNGGASVGKRLSPATSGQFLGLRSEERRLQCLALQLVPVYMASHRTKCLRAVTHGISFLSLCDRTKGGNWIQMPQDSQKHMV